MKEVSHVVHGFGDADGDVALSKHIVDLFLDAGNGSFRAFDFDAEDGLCVFFCDDDEVWKAWHHAHVFFASAVEHALAASAVPLVNAVVNHCVWHDGSEPPDDCDLDFGFGFIALGHAFSSISVCLRHLTL